ncbi:MAG: S24/S26 family peptidase [Clostridiales bacterium]|nr:S24/S26 family peptidase [Clostridiales bacterium]
MEEPLLKTVDTGEYVSMLRELTEQGREVGMVVSGNSMSPFIVHRRDSIFFKKPDRALRRGDFVFYQRSSGQYVCHRIYKIKPEGYYMVGDAQTEIEGPIQREQIFGLVTRVTRKGKSLAPGDFWWEFFEKVWVRVVPFRRRILKLYSHFSGQGKG